MKKINALILLALLCSLLTIPSCKKDYHSPPSSKVKSENGSPDDIKKVEINGDGLATIETYGGIKILKNLSRDLAANKNL